MMIRAMADEMGTESHNFRQQVFLDVEFVTGNVTRIDCRCGSLPLVTKPDVSVTPYGGQMLIGYTRVSKADGSQATDLQRDALQMAGVDSEHIYNDAASGKRDDRPGLHACLKAMREGDTLVIWKLDRLGRDLRHLVNTVHDLTTRGIGLRVLTGEGAAIDTTSSAGKLAFGIFAALAEFERELIRERTIAGIAAARARGRHGGRPHSMTAAKVRLAQAAMGKPETVVSLLCEELEVSRQTLYRHVAPDGSLRDDGRKVVGRSC